MSTLDAILKEYENIKPSTETQDIPREQTVEESELLSDYILNGNLQAIYDYHDLKDRLDKEWVDGEMYYKNYPFI